jgi:hypothetical protein
MWAGHQTPHEAPLRRQDYRAMMLREPSSERSEEENDARPARSTFPTRSPVHAKKLAFLAWLGDPPLRRRDIGLLCRRSTSSEREDAGAIASIELRDIARSSSG